MRSTIAAAFLIVSWLPCLASDDKAVHDCDYWRLGKDEAEQAELRKACDRIINDKSFSKADRALAYAERASAASSDSRRDDAIADLSQSLVLEPDNVERRRDRAFHFYFREQYDQAIADFDKVLAADPTGHSTIFRGFSYLAKGDDSRGFADLAKGIELSPEDAWYRLQRGKEYAKRGKTDEALADADKAIALKSDDVEPTCSEQRFLQDRVRQAKRSPISRAHPRSSPTTAFRSAIGCCSTSRRSNTISPSPTTISYSPCGPTIPTTKTVRSRCWRSSRPSRRSRCAGLAQWRRPPSLRRKRKASQSRHQLRMTRQRRK
jgi:tetratricopeptide (TPR) repeat protein